jgi:hypothetical protein
MHFDYGGKPFRKRQMRTPGAQSRHLGMLKSRREYLLAAGSSYADCMAVRTAVTQSGE